MKIHIDASVTDRCLVLNVFRISDGSYQLVEFDYGNLRSVKKMVKIASPAYLSFVEPTSNHMVKSSNIR